MFTYSVTYFTVHRLRERIDINWLPDRLLLLVFSYLSVPEIQKCAQVKIASFVAVSAVFSS